MSERDGPLSADRGFGAALDADQAEDIPLVGFGEDAGGLGDIAFIGFDDEAAPPGDAGARSRWAALWQRLGEAVRGAASAVRRGALQLFWWLHYRLFGTSLRARRSRTAAVVLGAVLLSIGCGLVLRHWLPAHPAGPTAKAVPAPAAAPVKSVLVARQAIGRGRVLSAADLQWVPWPDSDIKQSYVLQGQRRIPEFYGYVARRPIAAGAPISSDSIANPGKQGALAAVLTPGMRAVSVDIREETAASGLVMPGDDVDLLLALPVPVLDHGEEEASSSRYAVQTVLSNVRVLAIDQEFSGHDGRAMIGRTATLEVTPKEAEIVTLAGTMAEATGNLRLALRSLVPAARASPAPGSPEKRERNFLLESDISKLMPERTNPAALPPPLTIVRRGQASTAQPSSAGS